MFCLHSPSSLWVVGAVSSYVKNFKCCVNKLRSIIATNFNGIPNRRISSVKRTWLQHDYWHVWLGMLQPTLTIYQQSPSNMFSLQMVKAQWNHQDDLEVVEQLVAFSLSFLCCLLHISCRTHSISEHKQRTLFYTNALLGPLTYPLLTHGPTRCVNRAWVGFPVQPHPDTIFYSCTMCLPKQFFLWGGKILIVNLRRRDRGGRIG